MKKVYFVFQITKYNTQSRVYEENKANKDQKCYSLCGHDLISWRWRNILSCRHKFWDIFWQSAFLLWTWLWGIHVYMWDKRFMMPQNMWTYSHPVESHWIGGLKAPCAECSLCLNACAYLDAVREVKAKTVWEYAVMCFWYWSTAKGKPHCVPNWKKKIGGLYARITWKSRLSLAGRSSALLDSRFSVTGIMWHILVQTESV